MTEVENDYSRIEHIKIVQGVIGRMGQNSFALKGWSVTLVSALVALAVKAEETGYASLALFPAVAFWGLDGYYLWQERRFRSLHEEVCEGRHSTYTMRIPRAKLSGWLSALFRPATLVLHLAVLVVIAAVLVSLNSRAGR